MNINFEIEEVEKIEKIDELGFDNDNCDPDNCDSDNCDSDNSDPNNSDSDNSNPEKSNQNKDASEFETFEDFFLQGGELDKDNLLYVKKVDYMENYRVDDLKKIAKYYELQINRKKKEELVEDIIVFEDSLENLEMVQTRLMYWEYLEELKSHPFFKQFIVNF